MSRTKKTLTAVHSGCFDISSNTNLESISHEIDLLRQKYNASLESVKDVWRPLGRRAPLLRTVFNGVKLPIKNKKELVKVLGGNDRVFIAPSLDGSLTAVTVKDFIANIDGFLKKGLEFPVDDWELLVHQIIKWERSSKAPKNRLLRNIDNSHLVGILENKEKVERFFPTDYAKEFSEAFHLKKLKYLPLLDQSGKGATYLLNSIATVNIEAYNSAMIQKLIEALLKASENAKVQADIVLAKTSSAITHLNNSEQIVNNASGYLSNVLSANNLNSVVLNYNQRAGNLLDSANQLLAQAIADLAAAEAAAHLIPNNSEAQNAVAEAQAKLEQVQNQISDLIIKMARAEAHKDVLRIPEVCITIRCIEDDPCCDDDWNDVNVCISNTSNPDVEEKCGTTSGNGSVTICGRFGGCEVVVTTTGPKGWNVTRYYHIGNHGVSYTISVDLAGIE